MQPRSKKVIVSAVAVFGIAVLIGAGFALKRPILEHWYIWKLERGPDGERKVAVEWLGKNGSVRAARRIFEVAHRLSALPQAENSSSDVSDCIIRIGEALKRITLKERQKVVPLLADTLKVKPIHSGQGNQIRIGAANFLKALDSDAKEAIPALTNALREDDERFRRYVSTALEKIQGGIPRSDEQR